jgi:NAD binding domain of 6-phosphogluconate dehydrogenase
MKVGFIGLGQMGLGMAASLLKAGHEVTVYNRTQSKADELVKKGAVAAKRISDACAGDAVITMLANDAAVESVVCGHQGVRDSLREGAVHISSSTISVALCERLGTDHAAAGQRFVAAPVLGRPDVAAVGELTVVAGGSSDTIAGVSPLLDAIGRRTFVMSDQPRSVSDPVRAWRRQARLVRDRSIACAGCRRNRCIPRHVIASPRKIDSTLRGVLDAGADPGGAPTARGRTPGCVQP